MNRSFLRLPRPSTLTFAFGLALALTACDQKGSATPPPPDLGGISKLELRCTNLGFIKYHIWGERGATVERFWGRSWGYDPDFVGEAWGDGPRCLSASESGAFEVYLKRERDGQWVRAWLEAGLVEGEDGSPRFQVGSSLQTQLVREEELPFRWVVDDPATGRGHFEDRPPAPLWLPRAFCLQPGTGWPWGRKPGNQSPYYPPVAPASPPALYYGYEGDMGDPAFIEYTNGKYTAAAEYAFQASGVAAIAPADAPLKIVIYASWRARWHPLYGRWVRIYPKDPIALRMEGDRLVCEGYRPADWVVEMMPEGFNFPGFDPQRERFDTFNTPYKLPVELDPHAGR